MDGYVPLPPLPARLSRLNDLASNLWWSWNPVAREVFRDLDYPLWRFTDHNPVLLLHLAEHERLEHAASDPAFLKLYDDAIAAFDVVTTGAGTWASRRGQQEAPPIAIVAPRFSLHQALPVDSDGSAVAVGDFCKEASDLGVAVVGVGLMYPRGYAHQRLSGGGWQQESYEYLDWSDAPIGPALRPDGRLCEFTLPLAGGPVHVRVWRVQVGRVTLLLLDTDAPENRPWDRDLAAASFADEPEGSMRQRLLLGAGGPRALTLLGIEPGIWHLHEGGSAFTLLERVHASVAEGAALAPALDGVRRTTVFHTRVTGEDPRDHLAFATIERQMHACWPHLRDARAEVLALGEVRGDRGSFFAPAAFASRSAATVNGPSRRTKGSAAAPGIHVPSWLARELAVLVERYVGDDWRDHQDEEAWWLGVSRIPDDELWQARERLRQYLVDFTRERARRRWAREQSSGGRLVALGTLLDHATLTIGLAGRFTQDLRADFIFEDPQRLAAILTAARRPVQLVFAGRAARGDEAGKHHLQRLFTRALDPAFGGRIAFLEDYDLHAARLLVQGCDVWLSTPPDGAIPPLGALKAAINGAPHLATPAAACDAVPGWTVSEPRVLYRILEDEAVPLFYDRDRAGIPSGWLERVRRSLGHAVPRVTARRDVKCRAEQTAVQSPPA